MYTQINGKITFYDRLGAIAVRLGLRRRTYSVEPGLYELNKPDIQSPVFVSANYKLSFDHLRRALSDVSCRILVLDTKGINVWCAAGKGTFGTDEMVHRIKMTGLADKVNHRKLIVPQLGAPGIEAHIVRHKTGFNPVYGPVEARDIPAYIENGYRKTEQMHTKYFPVAERAVLTPVELVHSWKILLPVAAANIIFVLLISGAPALRFADTVLPAVSGIISGGFITPLLLPWIPVRPFSLKGAVIGFFAMLAWYFVFSPSIEVLLFCGGLSIVSSSFIAMNFTGASTFTSLSGVKKEMKFAVPLQIAGTLVFAVAAVIIGLCSKGAV